MQAWEDFLKQLEFELGAATISRWLRPLQIVHFDAGNLYLQAKDSFQIAWFEEHVRKKADAHFINSNHRKIKIHLSIDPPSIGMQKKKKDTKKNPALLPFGLIFDELNPHYTFETLLATASHDLPMQLLNDSIDKGNAIYNPLYFYGASSTGKTHFLMALAHAYQKKGAKVIYAKAETFTKHVISAMRAGEMAIFRQAYRNADVLLIDDVHLFARKAATQEELFHTFNTLHLAMKPLILSANVSPKELQEIEPRLISRFEWGIVLKFHPFNKEEVSAYLDKKLHTHQLSLNQKSVAFLSETFSRSLFKLNRAIEALALRNQSHEALTLAEVKDLLKDLILDEEKTAITADRIVDTVAAHYGIPIQDLLGKKQTRDCAFSRKLAMHLCRTKLNLSFMKVGEIFSRDHSTVISSIRSIQQAIEKEDREIMTSLDVITNKLNQ